MYSSISSIVSNPGFFAQDCHVGIFIPLKMGKIRPLLTPKKRGAPIGHKGANRPTKEPDKTEEVIADHCEKCNSLI
jgi:hypothetical protein